MIHEYLDPQHQYWSKFGIDMCLGMNLDMKPSNIQAIHFLPDYLFRGMDHAFEGNKRLVVEKQRLLSFPETKIPDSPVYTLGRLYDHAVAGHCFLFFKK